MNTQSLLKVAKVVWVQYILHHLLALLLIPNPRKYPGYKFAIMVEVEYFPLGEHRWEYLLKCYEAKTSPWKSSDDLAQLVNNANRRTGIWSSLLYPPPDH